MSKHAKRKDGSADTPVRIREARPVSIKITRMQTRLRDFRSLPSSSMPAAKRTVKHRSSAFTREGYGVRLPNGTLQVCGVNNLPAFFGIPAGAILLRDALIPTVGMGEIVKLRASFEVMPD